MSYILCQVGLSDRYRCTQFTRVEGGNFQESPIAFYEWELKNITPVKVFKKEVFSNKLKMKLTTRTIVLGKDYAHTLKFRNGRIYDITPSGPKLRGKINQLKTI